MYQLILTITDDSGATWCLVLYTVTSELCIVHESCKLAQRLISQ